MGEKLGKVRLGIVAAVVVVVIVVVVELVG